jgi:hypothetical protein
MPARRAAAYVRRRTNRLTMQLPTRTTITRISTHPLTSIEHRDIFTRVYDVEEEEELHSIYSDQTGRFPKKSSKGNQYIMVLVHINSGAILVAPMKDRTSGEMI